MSTQIPDRWLDYKPIGEPIKGTRFIAFKVPLSKAINESVKDIENRLDISQLLEIIPNLGLVIDLTFTTKYYNPQSFKDEGIEHVKLMIPGRRIPEKHHTNLFTKYVQDFINNDKNTDKLIGVHCTHGVNRTGFLICHHMVRCLKMQPEDAIRDFEAARGHQIERENYRTYINNLNINQDDGSELPDSFGTNRCSKRSAEPIPYASKSLRMEDQTGWRSNNNGGGNDVPYIRSRNRVSRFNAPGGQRPLETESWRRQEPSDSGHNYRYRDSNNDNGQQSAISESWRRQERSDSGHNFGSSAQRSYNNNRNSNNQSRNYNNSRDKNHFRHDNSRRDPLPSNNFETFSVMDQLYSDNNTTNRFRCQRPN